MSTSLGLAFLNVDSRRSEDAAVEGCSVADRSSISASAVAKAAAAAASELPVGGYSSEPDSVDGLSSLDEQQTAFQTESATVSPQHSLHSSFGMKLRHKFNK